MHDTEIPALTDTHGHSLVHHLCPGSARLQTDRDTGRGTWGLPDAGDPVFTRHSQPWLILPEFPSECRGPACQCTPGRGLHGSTKPWSQQGGLSQPSNNPCPPTRCFCLQCLTLLPFLEELGWDWELAEGPHGCREQAEDMLPWDLCPCTNSSRTPARSARLRWAGRKGFTEGHGPLQSSCRSRAVQGRLLRGAGN